MRPLLAALALLAAAPLPAAAQLRPRSVALVMGWEGAPGGEGEGPRTGLEATAWFAEGLEATAHLAWAAAARTSGRAADGAVEAGVGLRGTVARWPGARVHLGGSVGAVRWLGGGGWPGATAARLAGGGALELFVARDVAFGLAAELAGLAGDGPAGLRIVLSGGVGFYF